MSCKGEFFLGANRSEELLGLDYYTGTAQEYTGPVKLSEEIEWAYGTCKGKWRNVEGATYQHYNDRHLFRRVKRKMKEVQEEINFQYGVSESTTPITALILTIDSMSRRLFYRRLPKTYEFLKALDAEKHRVFDFKLSSILGDNSIPNIYPILTGYPVHHSGDPWKHENIPKKEDIIKDSSIWTYMKKNGWATMFAAEFCDNYFSQQLGRKPSVDHLVSSFWCAAHDLSDYSDTLQSQRCIGNKNSHFYILNYTNSYVKNYQGINKWAHVMVVSAHEDSGTVINTLDEDLEDFLRTLLKNKDNLMLFILGDHGPRYGSWKKSFDGEQEHKLPALFLVASTPLLKKIPFSFDVLSYNTQRLVSKLDLFKTLQHITLLPYYKKFEIGSFQYNQWQAGRFSMFGLMMDKIPVTRTCDDAMVHKVFCPCNEYDLVEMEKQSGEYEEFVRRMAEIVVDQINEEALASFQTIGVKWCQKVSLKRIVKLEVFKSKKSRSEFRFVLMVNEDRNAIIESEVHVFCTRPFIRARRISYPVRTLYLDGKLYYKVNYIKRIDENPCKEKLLARRISPHTCICKNNLFH